MPSLGPWVRKNRSAASERPPPEWTETRRGARATCYTVVSAGEHPQFVAGLKAPGWDEQTR